MTRRDTPGGSLTRWLLPAVVGVPLIAGWLRMVGERAGYYDELTGTALSILATIGVLLLIVRAGARALDRSDAERRSAEERTLRLQSFLDSIVDNVPAMVFVKEAEQLRFVRFNKTGEDLLGLRREDMIGKNDHDFFPAEQADFFTAKDRATLEGGTVVDIPEEPIQTRHLGTRLLHTKKVTIRDAEGRPAYLLGISEDITERKAAEEEVRRSRAEIQAANGRLAAAYRELEAFSYSVSHDLRTPLRHVDGFADLLAQRAGERLDEASRRYLEKIRAGAKRMGILIDELLAFSRASRAELRCSRVSLRAAAEEAIAEVNADLAGRDIVWRIGTLPDVEADPTMIRQVFCNLLANAVKYTAPRAQAIIEIDAMPEDSDEVVVLVRDNGVGFDMDYADKLFVVFQRLHRAEEFEGNGVGLANVRRIVDRHGGRTWAEGRVDRGATFYFSLPRRARLADAG